MLSMDTHKQRQIDMHKGLVGVYRQRVYEDPAAAAFYQFWERSVLGFLPQREKLLVLDCGAGLASLAHQAVQLGHEAVAFDLSMELLSAAEDTVKASVPLIRADGEQLPFQTDAFDAAVCIGWLHHLQRWDLAIEEIHRVLQRGGRFIISEPCDQNPLIRGIRRIMYALSSEFDQDDRGFTRPQLLNHLTQAGFNLVGLVDFGFTAYAFAGFPDKLPLLTRVPKAQQLVQCLIALDKKLSGIPGLRRLALNVIYCFEKP